MKSDQHKVLVLCMGNSCRSVMAEALIELLGFLYAECCTRNKAIAPQKIVCCK